MHVHAKCAANHVLFVLNCSCRDPSVPGSFWASPECARLDSVLHGQLTRPAPHGCPLRYTTIPVSIGFDYVELYFAKNRSTGVVCMK